MIDVHKSFERMMAMVATLEDLGGMAERARKAIASEVDDLRDAIHGQGTLPGLATDGDGEPLAGVAALERRIAELEQENAGLRRQVVELKSENECDRHAVSELAETISVLHGQRRDLDAAIRAALRHLGDLTVADTTRMRRAQRALRAAIGEPMATERAAD